MPLVHQLKHRFLLLCAQKHKSTCIHHYARFSLQFLPIIPLAATLVDLPEGSAPGSPRPPLIKPQACCAPWSMPVELSSHWPHRRACHRPSTPVAPTAQRPWADRPMGSGETLTLRFPETVSHFVSSQAIDYGIQFRHFNLKVLAISTNFLKVGKVRHIQIPVKSDFPVSGKEHQDHEAHDRPRDRQQTRKNLVWVCQPSGFG